MAYSVQTLAEAWECSTDLIYKLIREKKIKTFHVGTLTRISDKERIRCEDENVLDTRVETARLDGGEIAPSPVSEIRMVSVTGRD